MTQLYARFRAWLAPKISAKFYKAESFLANALAVVVGILPDLINLVISQWSMVDALPTLTPEHKLYLFGACNVIAMVLRARKQSNMPQGPSIPVATVNVPTTVDVPTVGGGSVPVQTEIRMVDAPVAGKADALYGTLVPSAVATGAPPAPASWARLVTFEEFVEYGRTHAASLVDGVPWSFEFEGHAVTHENDDLYFVANDGVAILKFHRGDALQVGSDGRLRVLAAGEWAGLSA